MTTGDRETLQDLMDRQRISMQEMGSRLKTPGHQGVSTGPLRQWDAQTELEGLVYQTMGDAPDTLIKNVADEVMRILVDRDKNDNERLLQIKEFFNLDDPDYDSTLAALWDIGRKSMNTSATTGENMHLGYNFEDDASNHQDNMPRTRDSDTFGNFDDVDSDEEMEGDDDLRPSVVTLQAPIRLDGQKLVRPEEIHASWLNCTLEGTGVTEEEVMDNYDEWSQLPAQELQLELENRFGLRHLSTAQLLSANFDVVVMYTKLAQTTELGAREMLIEQIKARGLGIEAVEEAISEELPHTVDLELIGRPSIPVVNAAVDLPPNSTRQVEKDYELFTVPAPVPVRNADWPLLPISDLPEFAQSAFNGVTSLNIVQSRVADAMLYSNTNVLVCAPTGAGKTNIALLAITRALHERRKVVVVSPIKALVQEQVQALTERLPDHSVAELSGDSSLQRHELMTIDVVVSTPEKWDIVGRKKSNIELVRQVGLMVIDEVHLLHDQQRGGVIENIVVRQKQLGDQQKSRGTRLVALSATLPNYRDVAEFLEAPDENAFFFDSSFRPVPLEQQFVGIKEKTKHKMKVALNNACVAKVQELAVAQRQQVLVFVHSRKDTAVTQRALIQETTLEASEVGIHHAGLHRSAREDAEGAFRRGSLRVLVSTATLASGVNLPAYAVIIKGTEFYNPASDGWQQMRPQDLLQMLGRAGRPGSDVRGVGVVISSRVHLAYFATVATLSGPIESFLMNRVVDSLNAEVVLNNVRSVAEARDWLARTFWAVRWSRSPETYGDNFRLEDVAHTVCNQLHQFQVAEYKYPAISPTVQGEIASNFYVLPRNMATYRRRLRPWMTEPDLGTVFAQSEEFSALSVRPGERTEIERLMDLVPFPVRVDAELRLAKVSVLLQALVAKLPLSGLSIEADSVYIAESSARLLRALFELAVNLKWGAAARRLHRMYTMVTSRLWSVGSSAFRQFKGSPPELAVLAERSGLSMTQLLELSPAQLGPVLRTSDSSLLEFAARAIASFPWFTVKPVARPLTSDCVELEIVLEPSHSFDPVTYAGVFTLIVEDQEDCILGTLTFTADPGAAHHSIHLFLESLQRSPYLFVRVLSDHWVNAVSEATLSMRDVKAPVEETAEFSLEPQDDELMADDGTEGVIHNSTKGDMVGDVTTDAKPGMLVRGLKTLLLDSENSQFLGLPPGSDTLNLLRLIAQRVAQTGQNALVIGAPHEVPGLSFMSVHEADVASRKDRAYFESIQTLVLFDLDDVDFIYEATITRILALHKQTPNDAPTVVGFGLPSHSAKSLANWLGAGKHGAANFGLEVRDKPAPTISIQKYDGSALVTVRRSDVQKLLEEPVPALVVTGSRTDARLARQAVLRLLGSGVFATESPRRVVVTHLDDPLIDSLAPVSNLVYLSSDTIANPASFAKLVYDTTSNALIYVSEPEYAEMVLRAPLSVESQLGDHLADVFVSEIAAGTMRNAQDAVVWLASSLLFRRLRANPSYYQSADRNEWLSDAVQTTFERLAALEIVQITDDEMLSVEPLELCNIMAHTEATVGDLEALGDAAQLAYTTGKNSRAGHSAALKTFDARLALAVAINKPLSLVFTLIDERQTRAQLLDRNDSPLMQIPWIDDDETVLRCQDAGIHSVLDFIAIEDDDLRASLLGFNDEDGRMLDVAEFVNGFPVVDVTGAESKGDDRVVVSVERDLDEGGESESNDQWYLVIGDPSTDSLLGFKFVTMDLPMQNIEVALAGGADHNKTAWLMCGNYVDADKEFAF